MVAGDRTRGEQLEPPDHGRNGVVLRLGLALFLDVLVAEVVEKALHELNDRQEECANRVGREELVAQAPRFEQ